MLFDIIQLIIKYLPLNDLTHFFKIFEIPTDVTFYYDNVILGYSQYPEFSNIKIVGLTVHALIGDGMSRIIPRYLDTLIAKPLCLKRITIHLKKTIDIFVLSQCNNLEYANFDCTPIINIWALKSCTKLRYLCIKCDQNELLPLIIKHHLTLNIIASNTVLNLNVKNLRSLRLNLRSDQICNIVLQMYSKLKHLVLRNVYNLNILNALSNLKSIEFESYHFSKITSMDIFNKIKKIIHVIITCGSGCEKIIDAFKNVVSLKMHWSGILWLSHVNNFINLRKIYISTGNTICLDKLNGCCNLEHVDIGCCNYLIFDNFKISLKKLKIYNCYSSTKFTITSFVDYLEIMECEELLHINVLNVVVKYVLVAQCKVLNTMIGFENCDVRIIECPKIRFTNNNVDVLPFNLDKVEIYYEKLNLL